MGLFSFTVVLKIVLGPNIPAIGGDVRVEEKLVAFDIATT